MSIRGRRSHSHVRRLMTPTASARPAVDVEIAETPLADADRLIATFRVRAYSEARQRQRQAATPEAARHWGQVANLIARRRQGDETATEFDARPAARSRERGVRPAIGFFEVDPLDELERVLAARPQRFRLRSIASAPISARQFFPRPKSRPPTRPKPSARPPQQTGRLARSACDCLISRAAKSSSGSRPTSASAETRHSRGPLPGLESINERRLEGPATGHVRGDDPPAVADPDPLTASRPVPVGRLNSALAVAKSRP